MALNLSKETRAFVADTKTIASIQPGDLVIVTPKSALPSGGLDLVSANCKRRKDIRTMKEVCHVNIVGKQVVSAVTTKRPDGRIVSLAPSVRWSAQAAHYRADQIQALPESGGSEPKETEFAAD